MTQAQRILLRAGIAAPVLYFGTVVLGSLFYPGYSHVTQYASELGSAAAPYPAIFNTGIALTGLATIAAGLGFTTVSTSMMNRRGWSRAVGALLALFGVAIVLGAAFPMPDPRHNGYGLGVTIHLAPFVLAVALRGHAGTQGLIRFLIVTGIVMGALFAISMGIGNLVKVSNVGLFQRTYAIAVFVWMGIAAFHLLRHGATASQPQSPGQPAV